MRPELFLRHSPATLSNACKLLVFRLTFCSSCFAPAPRTRGGFPAQQIEPVIEKWYIPAQRRRGKANPWMPFCSACAIGSSSGGVLGAWTSSKHQSWHRPMTEAQEVTWIDDMSPRRFSARRRIQPCRSLTLLIRLFHGGCEQFVDGMWMPRLVSVGQAWARYQSCSSRHDAMCNGGTNMFSCVRVPRPIATRFSAFPRISSLSAGAAFSGNIKFIRTNGALYGCA